MAIEHFRLDGMSLNGFAGIYTNLITNPSIEVDTTGWATSGTDIVAGATMTRVTSQHFSGVAALQVVTTAVAMSQGVNATLEGSFSAGAQITASVYLKGAVGGETLQIGLVNSPLSEGTNDNITITNAWARYTVTFTPTVPWAAAVIAIRTQTAAVRTFYVDAAMAEVSATANPYFDGSLPGYSFTGTEHASSSYSSQLDIADTPTFVPAPLRLDWVGGADADGSVPLPGGHSDNATLTLPLRIRQQATADLAWAQVDALVTKLEATRATSDGLELVWTPKDSTDSWILTAHSAEITGMPMDSRGDAIGYLLRELRFTVVFTCAPYLYREDELITYPSVQSYTNLITNPNFETNTTGWGTSVSVRNATGGTISRQTTQFHSGVASMRIVSTAVANQGSDYTALPVIVAQPITVAMWLRGNAGGESVKIVLGDVTVGSVTSSTLVLTTSWQQLSVTLTPGASGSTGVAIVQTAASIKTWFVDDVIAVYAATAPTYFDGGTSAARNTWTGTANASTSTQDGPVVSTTLSDVPGHVDAEATITITDTDSQSRRHAEWGLGENSAAALVIDSSAMILIAGTSTTRTGAWSASGVVRGTLATQAQALCGTGNLTHVGVHRAKARIYASSLDVRLRLAYRTADGPYAYTPWITPIVEDDFCEVAFGVVTISTVRAGAQQWDGRIEAYSTVVGDTLDVDFLEMLPAERWGKARGDYSYQAGLLVARDEFTGATPASALAARVAPLGGTWANTGAGADFAAIAAPLATDLTMARSSISDSVVEWGVLGSTDYTNVEVGVDTYHTGGRCASLVAGRWSGSTSYVNLQYIPSVLGVTASIVSLQVTSGSILAVDTAYPFPMSFGKWYRLRLVVFASGVAHGFLIDRDSGAVLLTLTVSHSAAATGGAVATGKPAIGDLNSDGVAQTRYYDNFYVATPPVEPVVINAARALEVRHDRCERVSSDGLTYGEPASYTGGRAYIPCAGDANRVTRLWAKARRNDVDESADANVADNISLGVTLRPRYRLPTEP